MSFEDSSVVLYEDYKLSVSTELMAYDSLTGPYTVTGRQCGTMFHPLAWWGQNSLQFPLVSKLAK